MHEMNNKAVVILSGGMDSSTLLYYVKRSLKYIVVRALSFDYNQRHRRELNSAQQIAAQVNVPWALVDVRGAMDGFPSALTSQTAVPEGHYAEETMRQTVVPNRNAIMLSIACGHAVALGAGTVFFGPHAGDHDVYPDCRAEFVTAFSTAMQLANAWTPVGVEAPFLHMTKGDIVREGTALGVPYHLTWTCYNGEAVACGRCGTCVERLQAFDEVGLSDPSEYVDRDYWRKVVQQHASTTEK